MSNHESKTNLKKKRSDLWLPEAGWGVGKLDEVIKKAQTSSYKIQQYWERTGEHKDSS